MEQISRIGMDTSKHLFQLHGVDAAEKPVLRRTLRRRDMITFFERLTPTRVAIEACGASHHWARLLRGFGHEVQLIAPQLDHSPPFKTGCEAKALGEKARAFARAGDLGAHGRGGTGVGIDREHGWTLALVSGAIGGGDDGHHSATLRHFSRSKRQLCPLIIQCTESQQYSAAKTIYNAIMRRLHADRRKNHDPTEQYFAAKEEQSKLELL